MTVRYWFTKDSGASTYDTFCDSAGGVCSTLTKSVTNLSLAKTNANAYLQAGFTSGSLAAGATGSELKLRVKKTDSSNFSETNDYSYKASSPSYTDWTTVTVYVNGVLVWGAEPS